MAKADFEERLELDCEKEASAKENDSHIEDDLDNGP